jgi:hypothetical protein
MSIPVLALPILNRYDLAYKMMDTVDTPVDRFYVVDNGGGFDRDRPQWAKEMHVCDPGANLGWGKALNLTILANLHAPWFFFVNSDIEFSPMALAHAEKAMWADLEPAVVMLAGFSAFGLNDKAIEKVGFFDESYHPCYCEDSDWHARAERIGGVNFHHIKSETVHVEGGSVTIKEAGTKNAQSYPANVAFHEKKWGGDPWSEKYSTPWDQGGDPSVTTAPKLSRLRSLAW